MPTISVDQNLLSSLLSKHGCQHDIDDVDHRLPLLGTDIDRCDEETLDIEIFPNRPDLLSAETRERLFTFMKDAAHNKEKCLTVDTELELAKYNSHEEFTHAQKGDKYLE